MVAKPVFKLIILALFAFQVSFGSTGVGGTCEAFYREQGQPLRPVTQRAIQALDLVSAAKELKKALARFTVDEHTAAKKLADEMLYGTKKRLFWTKHTGTHLALTASWFAYLVGSIWVAENVMNVARNQGHHNLLTLHYTNFFEGLGFMGVFHHGLCAAAAACQGVYATTQKIVGKIREKAQMALWRSQLESYNEQQAFSILLTATLFTTFNVFFELNGVSPWKIYDGNIDWKDFFSGQLGLATYYVLEKSMGNRLGYFPTK